MHKVACIESSFQLDWNLAVLLSINQHSKSNSHDFVTRAKNSGTGFEKVRVQQFLYFLEPIIMKLMLESIFGG